MSQKIMLVLYTHTYEVNAVLRQKSMQLMLLPQLSAPLPQSLLPKPTCSSVISIVGPYRCDQRHLSIATGCQPNGGWEPTRVPSKLHVPDVTLVGVLESFELHSWTAIAHQDHTINFVPCWYEQQPRLNTKEMCTYQQPSTTIIHGRRTRNSTT